MLVSLSSEVLPQFREFERTMATALNAAVMPPVSRYVSVLREALDGEGLQAPLLIMKSDGGVTSAATCVRQPVQTVLSGPAAGVIGAVSVGRSAGFGDIISIDVGGTSADICLVRDGRPEITKDGMIGPFPLKLPIVDIHTIGAGGGTHRGGDQRGASHRRAAQRRAPSRARCATAAAGASPPSPTPTWCSGASRPRCSAASCRSTWRRRARPSRSASAGRSASASRRPPPASSRSSTTRWRAPSAPCRWDAATIRGASRWSPSAARGRCTPAGWPSCSTSPPSSIPPRPGVLSTWGLLDTDIRATFVRTVGVAERRLAEAGGRWPRSRPRGPSSSAQAQGWLAAEQVPPERQRFERAADLRYEHQSFELTCPLGEGPLTAGAPGGADGHLPRRAPAALQLRPARGAGRAGEPARSPRSARCPAGRPGRPRRAAAISRRPAPVSRPVYFRGVGFVDTPSYARDRLAPGHDLRRARHRRAERRHAADRPGLPRPRGRRAQHPPGARSHG